MQRSVLLNFTPGGKFPPCIGKKTPHKHFFFVVITHEWNLPINTPLKKKNTQRHFVFETLSLGGKYKRDNLSRKNTTKRHYALLKLSPRGAFTSNTPFMSHTTNTPISLTNKLSSSNNPQPRTNPEEHQSAKKNPIGNIPRKTNP